LFCLGFGFELNSFSTAFRALLISISLLVDSSPYSARQAYKLNFTLINLGVLVVWTIGNQGKIRHYFVFNRHNTGDSRHPPFQQIWQLALCQLPIFRVTPCYFRNIC